MLLIHGSATDSGTWFVQFSTMASQLRMFAFDRPKLRKVEEQAELAATVLRKEVGRARICGSSFGGVVALELTRRYPELVSSLVLCEPPLAAREDRSAVPLAFGCYFEAILRSQGGEAAAEFFLRTVLSSPSYEAMPKRFQRRALSLWREIRADAIALGLYRPNYEALSRITIPVLLVGGASSLPVYRESMDNLAKVLPNSRVEIIPNAGHMMHIEQPEIFGRLLAQTG